MSPDEVALLKHAGQVLLQNSWLLVAVTLFYGIHLVVTFLAMYNLLVKRNKTTATWVLCVMVAVIFLIATTYFCAYVFYDLKLLVGALIANTELGLMDRLEIGNATVLRAGLIQLWVGGNGNSLLLIFGDGIVVWRAWAVWSNRPSVIILPASMLLAVFAMFLTASTMQTMAAADPSFLYGNIANLVIAGFAMSIATNLTSVILIGIKAYQHRKFMKDTIGLGDSPTVRVLMFLTESGIIYVVLQIITFCLDLNVPSGYNPFSNATRFFGVIMNFFSATYPSLVVLIVNNQHSIAQLTVLSTTGDRNPGTHISFARSIPQGTTDSSDNQGEVIVQSNIERHHDTEKVSEGPETKDLV